MLGTVLLLLFANNETLAAKLLGAKLLAGIGLISYSAYLWHQPIFVFARIRVISEVPEALFLALIAVTFVLAYLTYKFVETPFRDKTRIGGRKFIFFIGISSFLFIIFGILGHISNGWKNHIGTERQWEILDAAQSSPRRNDCHTRATNSHEGTGYLSPTEACSYQGDNVNIAVLGNSHGVELAWGLSEILRDSGKGILHLTYSGCGPSYGFTNSENILEPRIGCTLWTSEAMDLIVNSQSIRTVVISYSSDTFRGQMNVLSDLGRQRIASYSRIIETLYSAGKQVVLVLQAPRLPRDIEIVTLSQPESDNVKGVERDTWQQGSAGMYQLINDLPPDIIIVDPVETFCDAVWCYAVKNGNAMYYDTGHMSVHAGELLGERIYSMIQ